MKTLRLLHLDVKTLENYGDTLLFETVKQVFEGFCGGTAFKVVASLPLRRPISSNTIGRINQHYDAVVLGGGGLFMMKPQLELVSGWQWRISVEVLRKLKIPLVVFGVGNNHFRGQPQFSDRFRKHLAVTAEKACFFGLRTHRSLESIREYLPPQLKPKLTYQPCPTTLCEYIYPTRFRPSQRVKRALFEVTIGKRQVEGGYDKLGLYTSIRSVMRTLLEEGWEVRLVKHAGESLEFREFLAAGGVVVPQDVIHGQMDIFGGLSYYAQDAIVVGTRNHSQMIAFGQGRPVVTMICHDERKGFSEDISHPELGVEMGEPDFENRLLTAVHRAYESHDEIVADFAKRRAELYQLTLSNLADIYEHITGVSVAPSFSAQDERGLTASRELYHERYSRQQREEQAAKERQLVRLLERAFQGVDAAVTESANEPDQEP